MRQSYKNILVVLILVISISALISWKTDLINYQTDNINISGNANLQKKTFDQFLGINSVREKNRHLINSNYGIATHHRVFGMDAHVFTGEEFVKEWKGRKCVVDLSIPHDPYPRDKMGFNPAKGAGGFNFDEFLSRMKEQGFNTIPVLAKNLLYANVPDNNIINVWQIPWDDGGDSENPLDYRAYSSFLYQFTARYGNNKLKNSGGTIDPKLLKLSDNNEIKAGLGLVEAIEPGNEMDKEWFTDRENATPKELAAFLSAVMDGHMGLMGNGHGILTADPNMKILFPSPVDIKPGFIKAVMKELKLIRSEAEKRGYPVLYKDNLILTAHAYPFKDNSLLGAETSDIVENTQMFSKSYEFIREMRAEFGVPIYLTETGYDKVTSDVSPIGAPTNHTDSLNHEVMSTYAHAKHVSRLILSMYAAGYDRCYLFTLKDPLHLFSRGYKGKFATSGLTRKNGKKDFSWHVLNFMKKNLTGFTLNSFTVNDGMWKLKLSNNDLVAHVTWLGTNIGEKRRTKIPVQKNFDRYQLIDLSKPNSQIIERDVPNSSNIEYYVTEFPNIVVLKSKSS